MTQPRVQTAVDLQPLNTFGVAARAARFVELRTTDELPAVARWLEGRQPLLLGGGSNLLITRDLDEPVLRVALLGRRIVAPPAGVTAGPDDVFVEAAAGESWHGLVEWTLDQGLAGLENLALIPGTVGAAPIQNIGAYGVELAERFERLEAFDLGGGGSRTMDGADCAFGYRDSAFKSGDATRALVTRVTLRLRRATGASPRLDYGDLQSELIARLTAARRVGTPLTPRDVAEAVIAIRSRRLPDPRKLGNAGSFFRNPVVPAAFAAALRERFPGLPAHPAADAPDGTPAAKLSAAWLIEQAGWKGVRRGDAGVSDAHSLVLVNHGGATGAQLAALAAEIVRDVESRYGVRLEPEPRIV